MYLSENSLVIQIQIFSNIFMRMVLDLIISFWLE
jgi:hypothetical protein